LTGLVAKCSQHRFSVLIHTCTLFSTCSTAFELQAP
jgi:hypothetical protein